MFLPCTAKMPAFPKRTPMLNLGYDLWKGRLPIIDISAGICYPRSRLLLCSWKELPPVLSNLNNQYMTGSRDSTYQLPVLLTPSEAATVLRMSKSSLYRLVDKRILPFYRVSGSLRFDQDDLKRYLSEGRVEPVRR